MENEGATERMLIVCRQPHCGQKIAVPNGGEGHVRCPHCNRRFWTTTRHGAFVRALRVSLHSQEGIGKTAGILLGLAVLWIGGLWTARDELPHATAIMLLAAATSYSVLALLQRRIIEPNALSGAVREAKHFFLILGLAAALFLCLSIWKSSQMDPVSSSTTLRELEMLRDQVRNSHVVGLLKSTQWKVALLGLLVLALIIPLVHVRKALREANRLIGKGVRRFFYIATALSAFTFAGGLHDGNVTRSEATLNRHIEDIASGYQAYAAAMTPALLDALADELASIGDADVDDDGVSIRTQIDSNNPSPPIDRASPIGASPVNGPKPTKPNPGADRDTAYRKIVLKDLAAEFKTDAARVAENIGRALREDTAPKVPRELTEQTIQNARTRRGPSTAGQISRPEMKEVRGIVRGSLGLAMSGRVDPAGTLLEGLRAAHPLQGELKEFTKVLVDGPIQEAVREIVGDAIIESMSDINKSMRDCVKGAIARAKQTTATQMKRLKSSSRSIAGRVLEISRGIAGNTKVAGIDALYHQSSGDFPELWKEATKRLPGSAQRAADVAFEQIKSRTQEWSDARRAALYSSKAIELRNMSLTFGNEHRIATILIEMERNVLATSNIDSAYGTEVKERERRAAADRALAEKAERQRRLLARNSETREIAEQMRQEQQRKRILELLRKNGYATGEIEGPGRSGSKGRGDGDSSDALVMCTCSRTGITTLMPPSACRGPC